MSIAPLEAWWNLRQALIWIATRDLGWVAEAKPEYGFGGREARGDSFDAIWAHARTLNEALAAYTSPDIAKFELLAKVAEGELKAAQDGKALPITEFMGATVSDQDFLGTHIRRIETVQIGQRNRGDAVIYQPRFIAHQVMRLFPVVGSAAAPISPAEKRMTQTLEIQATSEHRRVASHQEGPAPGEVVEAVPIDDRQAAAVPMKGGTNRKRLNIEAALRATFGDDLGRTARDWHKALSGVAAWSKANSKCRMPEERNWRRNIDRIWSS